MIFLLLKHYYQFWQNLNFFNFVFRGYDLDFSFGKKIHTIFFASLLLYDFFLLSTLFDISYYQARIPGFFKGIFYLMQLQGLYYCFYFIHFSHVIPPSSGIQDML